jgi:hypothetical protein
MIALCTTIISLTIVAVVLFCAGQEAAEPYHIKADVLGETIEAYKQNHRDEKQDCIVNPAADRFPDKSTPGLYACTTLAAEQPMTYAEAKVDSRSVHFDDGRLYEVVYTFDSSWISKDMYGMYYMQLQMALTDKFGKPAEVRESDFANLTGAHLQNQTATWKNGVSSISLTKFVGGLYTTMLTFSSDALEEDARRKIVSARKPKSDM